MTDDSLEKIAYELAAGGLKSQESVLEEIRRRAATLFTAASVATAFLGARAIDRYHHGIAVFGFVAVGLALVACVLVLLPKKELAFTVSGSRAFEQFSEEGLEPTEARRWLAYWLQEMRAANQPEIDKLIGTFRKGCILLLIALGLWALQFVVPW